MDEIADKRPRFVSSVSKGFAKKLELLQNRSKFKRKEMSGRDVELL